MINRATLVIPTFNAAKELPLLLDRLHPHFDSDSIVIVDSSSKDGTPDVARRYGCRVISIPKEQFDHGATRNIGARELKKEFIVFMTQDALPEGPETIEALLEPFADPSVAATYARQLPRPNAGSLERFARLFNYPDEPRVQSLGSLPTMGIKAIFLSDSCSAYRRSAFEQMDAFPEPCIANEDMYMGARLMLGGYKVVYTPKARVYHSHSLKILPQARRYFNIGVFFSRERWILERAPITSEGFRFLRKELAYLVRQKEWALIPAALADAASRFIGLQVGLRAHLLPSTLRGQLLYNPAYWDAARVNGGGKSKPAGQLKVFEVLECGGPGGTGNQVAAICNGLDSTRFDVNLVYSVRPASDAQSYAAQVHGANKKFYVPQMVREITPFRDLRAAWRLYRIFRSYRPDVVHAHSSKAGFLARVAAKLAGVPQIYYSPRGYSFLQTDRSRVTRWFYRLLELSVSWIGVIVAISDNEAELAGHLAKHAKVKVIRDAYLGEMPAYPALFPLGASESQAATVCGVGRLIYARNPEAFVRLAARLAGRRADVRCLWVGGGELEPMVGQMVREMGLKSKVGVTGWLSHPEAVERLKNADVFVHFSRWDGLPNAVLEAMALQLPVVASDIPANRDLIEHGVNGFLAKNEEELAEYTLKLIDEPQLRARFGQKGRELVEQHYSIDKMLESLERLYEDNSPRSAAHGTPAALSANCSS